MNYMIQKLRFPLLHVAQCILYIMFICSLYSTCTFLAAQPIINGRLQSLAVPASWEAAVNYHGRYLRWYTIHNHMIAFVSGIIILIFSVFALNIISKALLNAQAADQKFGPTAYRIANGVVMLAFFSTCVLFAFLPWWVQI